MESKWPQMMVFVFANDCKEVHQITECNLLSFIYSEINSQKKKK